MTKRVVKSERDRLYARSPEFRPYIRRAETIVGGLTVIRKAICLARDYPRLSVPELLRLASER
jgi:hypothetical protein